MQRYDVGGREVVKAEGELDLSHAPELRKTLQSAIEQSQADVALDLTGASYVDSAILQELIRAHNALSKQDRQFIVVVDSASQPGQVIHTVMFHTIMKVVESLDELQD